MLARVLVRLDRFAGGDRRGRGRPRGGRGGARRRRGRAAAASADALVTLAVCAEYGGQPERARRQLDEATALARRAGNLGVELRAYYAIGLSLLDAGRLRAAGDQLAAGARRAEATGTTWSGYGLDLRVGLVIARFVHGDWDAAEAAAELAGESVSATVAARLAAVGLLVAAGRGRFDAVDRRLAELREIRHGADDQVIMFAGQSGGRGRALAGPARRGPRARARGAGRAGASGGIGSRTWVRSCWPRSGWPRRPIWRPPAGGPWPRRPRPAGELVDVAERAAAGGPAPRRHPGPGGPSLAVPRPGRADPHRGSRSGRLERGGRGVRLRGQGTAADSGSERGPGRGSTGGGRGRGAGPREPDRPAQGPATTPAAAPEATGSPSPRLPAGVRAAGAGPRPGCRRRPRPESTDDLCAALPGGRAAGRGPAGRARCGRSPTGPGSPSSARRPDRDGPAAGIPDRSPRASSRC